MNQETLGSNQSPQKSPEHFASIPSPQTQPAPKHEDTCKDDCCEIVWKPVKVTAR